MKRFFALVLSLCMVLALAAGCGGPASSTASPAAPAAGSEGGASSGPALTSDIKNLSIGGAGTSGTFYIMASAYADMITKGLGINTVAEVTAGSVENVTLMNDKKIEMGVVQLDVTLDALAGTGKFTSPVPLTVLAPMYPNVIQIVTLADSDIKTFADLKGKRVSVGSPGSGILATNEIILKTLGLSMEDIQPQYLSFTETTDAFRNNALDAVIVNTAAPAPFLVDLETTNPIKIIPLSAEEIGKFTENFPFYVEATIPAGSYKSVPEETKTFAVWIALMARADMPDDVAYQIAKTLFEGQEYLKDVHVVAQYLNTGNVGAIHGVPYHPGVLQYLKDQGISVGE